jgi:Glycosyltransferase
MRILYFTDTYLPQINGVTNTLDKLGAYFENNKIEYLIFAPYYPDNSLQLREIHVKRFRSMSLPAYPECKLSIPLYSNLCHLADKFKPDVVHLMTPAGIGVAGLKYAHERDLPLVSSFTTSFDAYLKYYKIDIFQNLIWSFFKWFHNSCDINLCPSQDTINTLESRRIRNIKLMSRGIDTDVFNPLFKSGDIKKDLNTEEKMAFLYVGRLAAEKDLDILMESIRNINGIYPGLTRFVIAGDGPYASCMKKTAPDNVLFTGYIKGERLSSIYASCDVFVFPSSTETFGNVVLEAMASGLPVIAVNSGGVKNSIINGYNGILCDSRDVGSFTRAICRFIEDKTLAGNLGINARQYTLDKSWNSIFDRLMSDYLGLLEQTKINSKISAQAV